MRLLLALLLVGCAPDRATVAKVAHVAVSGSSFDTGKPMSDPETVSLARGYLQAAAASLWLGVPTSQALSNVAVGQAIEGALPPNTSQRYRVRLLERADASLAR